MRARDAGITHRPAARHCVARGAPSAADAGAMVESCAVCVRRVLFVLPGAVLFVVGVVATLGISWFDRRKDRPIKTWAVAVIVVSIPYGIAAWWVWSIDDDRFPVGVLGSAGLLVGYIVAHFMFDRTPADRTDGSPPSDSN